MPTVAFSRTGWFLLLLTVKVVAAGAAVGWHEVVERTHDTRLATAIAIAVGLASFTVVAIVTSVIIVEGYAMLAERYFKERYERGRQVGREEGHEEGRVEGREEGRVEGREEEAKVWRAWHDRMRAAQAAGQPFDEPPPSPNGAHND